ncbi:MAG: protein BatD, partial [Krumholzibacteria bacterium]|nr:protein BatD [Candidatus Krumholzibacteria bacterium]
LLAVAPAAPAAMVCEARVNRTTVPAGGELALTVSVEGDIGWSVDFALPDLPGVRVYNGGTNQSMSVVNGRTRTTVTRTWYLRVETEGSLEIGAVTATAQGQTCRTEPLRVTVTAPQPGAPPTDTGNRTAPPAAFPSPPVPGGAGSDIFVTLEVDKPQAWLGEQIILTFRYWWRVQPWNNPSYTPPRTEGFWREDLGPERALREVREGRVYSVTEIRYALFPTRAGKLVIEPAELAFPEDVFDRFFNSRRRSQGPRILRSERLTVDVRPLPQPAPPEFSGLVANDLQLTARVAPDTVAAGEPVELELQLVADGFLKGFAGLKVPPPEAARMHAAAESFAVGLRGERLQGSLGVEKVLVPERAGTLTIPPTSVTWFDAGRGRYVTSTTPVHRVHVEPGTVPTGDLAESGFLRSGIARLGQDLAFIQAPPRRLRAAGAAFTGSPAWWLLLGMPVVLLAGWRVVLGRLEASR